ncbi:MAG: hypothetical protein RIQ47_1086 [Bacteroidota bacterium]|jgi:four helix bundle protein
MATIKRFEELESWKLARKLVVTFYKESTKGSLSSDYKLRDQMRGACISIMSNLAEGFERNGNREFIQFCYIAKASAGEFRSQLYIATDLGYFNKQTSDELMQLVLEVTRLISGLIRYLCNSNLSGAKYSEHEEDYKVQESFFSSNILQS